MYTANLIGQKVGSYELVALIGRGATADVYRAHETLASGLSRDVALKLIGLRIDEPEVAQEFVERFKREAKLLTTLDHPHIVKAFAFGQADASPFYGPYPPPIYISMQLLGGGSLSARIRKGALSFTAISRLLDEIGSALDYAHSKGVIHRDMKPQNVLFDETDNAFLTDFGLAKLLSSTTVLTQRSATIGTPAYMSPEQCEGQSLDGRTDLYSLGIILFEMLTQHLPFIGDSPSRVMYQHVHQPPPQLTLLRADVPPAVESVIRKALEKNPENRYQSGAEFAQAFKTALVAPAASGAPNVAASQQPWYGQASSSAQASASSYWPPASASSDPQFAQGAVSPPIAQSVQQVLAQRPWPITLIAGVSILGALVNILQALSLFSLANSYNPYDPYATYSSFTSTLAAITLILASATIAASVGLFQMKRWGYWSTIVLNILGALGSLSSGSWLGLIIDACAAGYLLFGNVARKIQVIRSTFYTWKFKASKRRHLTGAVGRTIMADIRAGEVA